MVIKKYIAEILVFFIFALYGHVNGGKTFEFFLKNANDTQSVQTPGGSRFVSPLTSITWKLYAPDGFHLQLQCFKINLNSCIPWGGALLFWNGSQQIDIGRTRKSVLSVRKVMKLELKTGLSRAQINCTVQLNPDTTCHCGWSNKANKKRIVNGEEAQQKEFVFMAYLRSFKNNYANYFFDCTASIITQRHILTAAHCLNDYPDVPHDVVVGGHALKGDNSGVEQKINIRKVHAHESYKKDIRLHDIAIIELFNDIKFSQFVGPVCLPSESYDLTNQWVKVLGWGFLGPDGPISLTLQTLEVQVWNMDLCTQANLNRTGSETKLCFDSRVGATCYGDSGGPLIYYDTEINRYVQVGFVVTSGRRCRPGDNSFGPNISFYLDWIKGVIERDSSGLPKKKICQKNPLISY